MQLSFIHNIKCAQKQIKKLPHKNTTTVLGLTFSSK